MGGLVVLLTLSLAQPPAASPNRPAPPPAKPAAAPAPAPQAPPAKPGAPAPTAQTATPPPKPATPPASPTPPAPPTAAATTTPPPAKPGTPAPAGQAAPPAPQPPAETYSYRADGRRDPFQSLLTMGSGAMTSRKGEGPGGMTLSEISVRGVLQSRGTLVAMIQGPDNKTYIVHQGDKLLDGTIKTITPQGLVVVQEVNDPLSLVKQREIRKLLRSLEDAKE
jgi:Tfp pilus assembly protein PilP